MWLCSTLTLQNSLTSQLALSPSLFLLWNEGLGSRGEVCSSACAAATPGGPHGCRRGFCSDLPGVQLLVDVILRPSEQFGLIDQDILRGFAVSCCPNQSECWWDAEGVVIFSLEQLPRSKARIRKEAVCAGEEWQVEMEEQCIWAVNWHCGVKS